MERRYETVCIVRPDAGDDVIKGVIHKAKAALEAGHARINKVEEWGRRRLAYAIMKKHEGFYFLLDYASAPEVSKELERILRLSEDVMRSQTVVLTEAAETKAADAETAVKGGADGGKD
ncbi:MAG: 30S ribosomal protein S6 [Deltaproteobacteria bacterium]|nr:30S ribosomal protein S6 [Deltaproteobacteria bacterium]